VDDAEWFDFDGPVSDGERAFLAALRQRVEGRIRPWCTRQDAYLNSVALVVGIDVDAPGLALVTAGVHLDGDRIRGDRLHLEDLALPDHPTSLAIDVTGPPAHLAAAVAEWFAAILCRPIVRYEWLHAGRVYASRYLFADTGEGLSEMYNRPLAPPGQHQKLISAGQFHGRGWIDTRGLGEPDRVIPIRGCTCAPS
jgi:hypothetical protein